MGSEIQNPCITEGKPMWCISRAYFRAGVIGILLKKKEQGKKVCFNFFDCKSMEVHCCVQNTGCKGIIKKTLLYSRVWEQRWIENWHECVFDVCRKSGFWWRERERKAYASLQCEFVIIQKEKLWSVSACESVFDTCTQTLALQRVTHTRARTLHSRSIGRDHKSRNIKPTDSSDGDSLHLWDFSHDSARLHDCSVQR